jgi:hypothetical protein
MATDKAIAVKTVDHENMEVRWTFSDGTTRTVRAADFPTAIREQHELHGIAQRYGDVYSGAATKYTDEGYESPVEYAIAVHDELVAASIAGDWTRRGGAGDNMTTRALAAVLKVKVEEAAETWNGWTEAKRKAVRTHPEFKLALTNVRRERELRKAAAAPSIEDIING